MKILKVNYVCGEALIRVAGFDMTFCVALEGITTKKQVKDRLTAMIPKPDNTEDTFNNLNLKDLEGTDI